MSAPWVSSRETDVATSRAVTSSSDFGRFLLTGYTVRALVGPGAVAGARPGYGRLVTDVRPTARPGRVGPVLAAVVAVLSLGLIAWSGVTGASRQLDGPAPTGVPASGTQVAPEQPDPALARFYNQQVTWSACNDGAECMAFEVPLDYAAPNGDAIQIQVVRLAAGNPDARLGSLVLNPGGPGGSGVEYALAADFVVSPQLRRSYDIVGFDPRGVGTSAPVECLNDAETDGFLAADGSPDTDAELADLISGATDFGALCAQRASGIAPYVDSESAARDIDILRHLLGDERLNWLGKSYGTYLGTMYASLFPGRVGRMVLDGAVAPQATLLEISRGQAEGFERALVRYIADCVDTGDCPLGDTVEDALAELDRLIAQADRTPFTTDDKNRPLTQGLFVYGVLLGLYDTAYGWPSLTAALQGITLGSGTPMLTLVDTFVQRENGRFRDNSFDALNAVTCLDYVERQTLSEVEAFAADLGREFPRFGTSIGWGALSCTYWPYPPAHDGLQPVSGAGTILVIGTEYDPATPVEWATSLKEFIEGSILVTWKNGDGHTAYLSPGARCVDRIVDSYFLSGLVPEGDTVCT